MEKDFQILVPDTPWFCVSHRRDRSVAHSHSHKTKNNDIFSKDLTPVF